MIHKSELEIANCSPAERGEALLDPGEKAEISCYAGCNSGIRSADVEPNEEHRHQVGQRVDPVDHKHHSNFDDELNITTIQH